MARKSEKDADREYLKQKQDELVQELMGLTEDELNARFMIAKKNENAAKKQKKEDQVLIDLIKKIKEYRDNAETDEIRQKKEDIKEFKKQVDSEIIEDIENKKVKIYEHSVTIKSFTKEQKIIMKILRERQF